MQDEESPIALRCPENRAQVQGSIHGVAGIDRFQRPIWYAAEWIDADDPSSLVTQSFKECVTNTDDHAVFIPVVPQPHVDFAAFILAPDWNVELWLTPVLLQSNEQ